MLSLPNSIPHLLLFLPSSYHQLHQGIQPFHQLYSLIDRIVRFIAELSQPTSSDQSAHPLTDLPVPEENLPEKDFSGQAPSVLDKVKKLLQGL